VGGTGLKLVQALGEDTGLPAVVLEQGGTGDLAQTVEGS
jgi:hypothetical protein